MNRSSRKHHAQGTTGEYEVSSKMSSDLYEPIDCGVHDQLLARATLRQPTEVTYENEQGETVVVTDVIEDVFTRAGAEYLRLSNGVEIRLDKIAHFTEEE